MEEQGWLQPRSRVLDVFGGIGTTGIEGASRGHEVVCVELEERFVKLALENFALHRHMWEVSGDPLPVMLHGDSRKAAELVHGHFAATVGSPPFNSAQQPASVLQPGGRQGVSQAYRASGKKQRDQYGKTEGQLGAMKEGEIDIVVGSPPFHDDLAKVAKKGIGSAEYAYGTLITKEIRLILVNLNHIEFGTYLGEQRELIGLSKAEVDRQIGTNTAYSFYEGRKGSKDQWRIPLPNTYRKLKEVLKLDDRFDAVLLNSKIVSYERRATKMGHTQTDYGVTEGQLGAMKEGEVDSVVSSPPYAANEKSDYLVSADGKTRIRDENRGYKQGHGCFRGSEMYGGTEGQLGREREDTFWTASRTILEQVYQLVRPGGVCGWITKDYVKAGKRVPFSDNWARLCEAIGFQVIQRARCWLVKEETHEGLFEPVTKRVERKSFFRRLHEKKPGAVRIDWEDVLFVQKV